MSHADTSRASALHRRTVTVAGVLAVVAAIAGCSGAKNEANPPSTPPSTTQATPIAQATATKTNGAAASEIKAVYTAFFNPATSLHKSVTLLQNGPAFKKTLKKQATTSFAKATTATVTTVTLNSPSSATVVYTILLSGKPVLVNTTGAAVHENGTWKVSGATFCGLLAAQGPPPPICARTTATPAPN